MQKAIQVKTFFDATDIYLKNNPVVKLRKFIIKDILSGYGGLNIIDVGCGDGELTLDLIEQNTVTFLDLSENMLALSKKKIPTYYWDNAKFIQADIMNYAPNIKYDIVVCFGVLAHVENVESLILKLKDIVKENGLIILQYSDSDNFISKINYWRYKYFGRNKYNYNINQTSTSQINKILVQVGLVISYKIVYLPISPLFSIFGYKTRLKLLFLFYKKQEKYSYLGSEIVLCIKCQ
jgi:2-polyprenyl-3-methyl-5-hydroxy-6-metoxy-1,4-benzoquinol methylase